MKGLEGPVVRRPCTDPVGRSHATSMIAAITDACPLRAIVTFAEEQLDGRPAQRTFWDRIDEQDRQCD